MINLGLKFYVIVGKNSIGGKVEFLLLLVIHSWQVFIECLLYARHYFK